MVRGGQSSPIPAQQPAVIGGSWRCARVTGKAGENGQHSAGKGGSSPWTRPSAPGCGHTSKAVVGGFRWIQGGDQENLAPGSLSLSTGSPGGRTPNLKRGKSGDGSMYSQAHVRARRNAWRGPVRAYSPVIVGTDLVFVGSGRST